MAPHEHPLDGDVAEPEHVRRGGQVLRGEAARTPTFDQLLLDGRQHSFYRVDPQRLARAIDALIARRP